MQKLWTVIEQRKVIDMFKTMTAREISEQTGRSKCSIYAMVHRIKPTHRKIRRKGELEQLVRDLHAQNLSDVKIGVILGLRPENIFATRKRLGLQAVGKSGRPPSKCK